MPTFEGVEIPSKVRVQVVSKDLQGRLFCEPRPRQNRAVFIRHLCVLAKHLNAPVFGDMSGELLEVAPTADSAAAGKFEGCWVGPGYVMGSYPGESLDFFLSRVRGWLRTQPQYNRVRLVFLGEDEDELKGTQYQIHRAGYDPNALVLEDVEGTVNLTEEAVENEQQSG